MGNVVALRPGARAGTDRTIAAAVATYLDAHTSARAWADGTAIKYRQTLTGLSCRLPAATTLADLDTAAGAEQLRLAFGAGYDHLAPATRARHLATLRSAIRWWHGRGWLTGDPTDGWARPRIIVDTTRALTRAQVDALFRLDGVQLREKTLWRMLYDTAARAEELLTLDVGDLDRPNNRARVLGKGGRIEWVHWQTGTALLLPRLIAGREHGPLFLADRLPTRATPAADLCPVTGRARLSYRRAAELFGQHTRRLLHPDVPADQRAYLDGWTLHQLRHSALTHEAEDGTSDPLLLARSRHASMRSLERYARPGPDAVAAHVARRDPAARRRT